MRGWRALGLSGVLVVSLLAPSGGASAAEPLLGPFGYGKLKLGQTSAKAYKTGLIVAKGPKGQPCAGFDLKAHRTPKDTVGGYLSKKVGVAAIFAVKGMKTPRGIKIGSTKAQLKKAYPKLRESENALWIPVPGNAKKAQYLFLLDRRGKRVDQIALALKTQDCFN